MRYREGDKIEVIDEKSEFYKKKGTVFNIKHNDKIWVHFGPVKSNIYGFDTNQINLVKSSIRGKEVEPASCCVSNLGGVSASVLLDECPAKKKVFQHDGHCICTYRHGFGVLKCEYFRGLKEVTRGGRKVWRVFCDAVEIA